MIEATDFIGVQLSEDGTRLQLRARDRGGQTVSFSMPVEWLDALLKAVPRPAAAESVQPLASWSMDRVGDGQDLVLTLRTLQGHSVSFSMKPWQVDGMATIATYGRPTAARSRTLH